MSLFSTIWTMLVSFITSIWKKEGPALAAWLKQFKGDLGSYILQEAASYGPQILSGSITITEAKDKILADLTARGVIEINSLVETIFNALRTQTNLAATA